MHTFWLPFLLLLQSRLFAAGADSLSMEEAQRLAFNHHRDAERVRLLEEEWRIDRLQHRLTLAPRLDLQLVAPDKDDSRNEVWTGDSLQQLVWVDWNQQRESADLRLSAELPLATRLNLSGGAYHRESSTQSFDEEYGNSWTAGISQDLIPRSTLLGDLKESARELDLKQQELLDELARFRYTVSTAYRQLLLARRSLALSRKDLQASRDNLDRAGSRFDAGLVAESEFLRVEVESLGREASFVSDSIRVRRQEEDFGRLTGLETVPRLEGLDRQDNTQLSHAELKEILLRDNTRLLRRRFNELRMKRASRSALLDQLPELELNASWSWLREGDEWEWTPGNANLNRSLRLDFRMPLFDRLEKRRAWRMSVLARKRAGLDLAEVEEDLLAELEQLWNQRGEELRLYPLKKRQTELADRDVRITMERFSAGQVTSQDLIDAERVLSQTRLDLLRLEVDLATTEAELKRLCGLDRAGLDTLLRSR